MRHGIISSCQLAATSEIVKRCCSSLVSSAITSTQQGRIYSKPGPVQKNVGAPNTIMVAGYGGGGGVWGGMCPSSLGVGSRVRVGLLSEIFFTFCVSKCVFW